MLSLWPNIHPGHSHPELLLRVLRGAGASLLQGLTIYDVDQDAEFKSLGAPLDKSTATWLTW